MLSMEEQKVLVEQILGSPLPQLDEIYMQGAKLYDTTAPNRFITPYLLSLLYTPFEMKLVLQLPGSAEEVAEKLGLEQNLCARRSTGCCVMGGCCRSRRADPAMRRQSM